MAKTTRVMVLAILAAVFSTSAAAQGFDLRRLFFGAGASVNSVSGADNSVGAQVFGGYNFPAVARNLYLDAEAGYMDTGKFDRPGCVGGFCDKKVNGLWATGVIRYLPAPQVELIGRAGVDIGDDDGPMVGIGAGYIVNPHLKLRVELVARDNVDSVQFNVVVYPW